MGFQDVAFLPSQASFPPHFLKIVVEVKASGPPQLLQQSLFLCQLNFMKIKRLSQMGGESDHPQFWGFHRIQNIGVCLS